MALENKLSNMTFFISAAIALTGASLLGHCFEYCYNKLDSSLNNSTKEYRQTLNNTNSSQIYTNR